MTADALVVDVSDDWAVACDVQQRFMQQPTVPSDAITYSAQCRQARAVGGDFYDVLPLPDESERTGRTRAVVRDKKSRLVLAIGDASGKSIPAALMILGVQSSLRTAASFAGEDPALVLRTVNSHVHATSLADRFATLFYGVFDGNTRTLRYVNAGHNPPLVVRQDGSILRLETGGAPVGIFPSWDYKEGVVHLRPGDLFIAYTDGVTEAMNAAGEEWSVEGLLQAVVATGRRTPDDIACSIFRAMDEFSRGRQTDDATVLVARVH